MPPIKPPWAPSGAPAKVVRFGPTLGPREFARKHSQQKSKTPFVYRQIAASGWIECSSEQDAMIEQAVPVQSGTDPPHDLQGTGRHMLGQELPLESAHAMFGRQGAVEIAKHVIDTALD